MILSRWTCDTCFVTVWMAQGFNLSACVRCGNDWRHVKDDVFDDLCTCKRKAKAPRQTKFAAAFLSPMMVADTKTGSGAKRPKAKPARRPQSARPLKPEPAPVTMALPLRGIA